MAQIYVASVADQRVGVAHGAWVTVGAGAGVDAALNAIDAMLKGSEQSLAEQWAILDHRGFGRYSPDEHACIEEVCAVAAAIDTYGMGAVEHALRRVDAEEVGPWLDAHYRGAYVMPAHYAVTHYGDWCASPATPPALRQNVDWAGVAETLSLQGYHFEELSPGQCLVFAP